MSDIEEGNIIDERKNEKKKKVYFITQLRLSGLINKNVNMVEDRRKFIERQKITKSW